ncbi:MAG TPA: ATP synthase subunit I [Mycobacteriales bacterium]
MQNELTVPTNAATNIRRSIIMAIVIGVAALVGTSLAGHPLAGVFGCAGLGLGALNVRLVQRSVVRFAEGTAPRRKQQFAVSVFGRLALITAVAVALGLLVRPDGLGIFGGLALFQLLMLGNASFPLFKEFRET